MTDEETSKNSFYNWVPEYFLTCLSKRDRGEIEWEGIEVVDETISYTYI